MHTIRTIFLATLMTVAVTEANAQSDSSLLGKWEASYEEKGEKAYITYVFKKEQGKLKCYTQFIRDESGKGAEYHSIALKAISFKNGKGNAIYLLEEEGKNYELKANLELVSANTLTIKYSYWGYSEVEKWKKIE